MNKINNPLLSETNTYHNIKTALAISTRVKHMSNNI